MNNHEYIITGINMNWEVADDITHHELSFMLEKPKQVFNRILKYFVL